MRVLITGVAGFIGSHLAEALLARGDTVAGLDNFDDYYPRALKEANLASARESDRFTFVEGDIRSAEDLDPVFRSARPETVVHLAARAGVRSSIEDPLRCQDVNLRGTVQVLEAMRRHGAGRLVFAGSSSVYGNNRTIPFHEDDPVDHPISPYAATKKACELLCHTYHHLCGIDVTVLRFFTVYGPRQRPDLAIRKFADLLARGEAIPVYGDGSTSRDYTYVDDIIQGVLAAIDRCAGYHIYNLGESQPVRLDALVECIARHLGVEPSIQRLPRQPGDVDRTYADISRARSELGYAPSTDLETGMARFVEWFRGHG